MDKQEIRKLILPVACSRVASALKAQAAQAVALYLPLIPSLALAGRELGDVQALCLSQALTLAKLPSSITELDLSRNFLSQVPAVIMWLPALKSLNVSNNQITFIPYALSNIRTLRQLLAQGNPLRGAQKTQAENGTLLGYLKDCASGGSQQQQAIKLMMLGDKDAGKTSICTSLQSKRGFLFSTKLTSEKVATLEAFIHRFPMQVKGHRHLDVTLTDPPGESHLAPAVQFFLSAENMIVLLVFDAKRALDEELSLSRKSGETRSEQILRRWLSMVCDLVTANRLSSSCRTILVGTHIDKCKRKAEQVEQDLDRLVKQLQQDYIAAGLQLKMVLVHALIVEDVHDRVWREIFTVADELLKDVLVPKYMNELPFQLSKYCSSDQAQLYMDEKEFTSLLTTPAFGSLSVAQSTRALGALRRTGYVLQLDNGTVFPDPQYFASAVHAVMNEKLIPDSTIVEGRTTRASLSKALMVCPKLSKPPQDITEARQLVQFFIDVDVCLPDRASVDDLIIPSRLVGTLVLLLFSPASVDWWSNRADGFP